MHIEWPPLILGIGILAAGVLVAIFSRQVTDAIATSESRMFGSLGKALAGRSRSWAMVPVGIFAVLIGTAMILLALFFRG